MYVFSNKDLAQPYSDKLEIYGTELTVPLPVK